MPLRAILEEDHSLSLRLNGVFIDLNSTEQTEKVCSVNTEYALH